jgi:phage terminase large subunit
MAKAPTEIRSLARSHTETALKVLAGIMQQDDAPAAARVGAATALLDRGWGKPTQPIAGDDDADPIKLVATIKRVIVESTLEIPTARVFRPLLEPARYKGARGGRGSGKSHFFAELLVEDMFAKRACSVCIREVQKSLKESAKRLIEDKIQQLGVGRMFDVQADKIETPGDGVIIFQGMQDHTAESIKSLEGFKRAWIEEAQTLSERSLTLLRPTIRADGSELWASWNPRRKSDAIDDFLRSKKPARIRSSSRPTGGTIHGSQAVLEDERQLDLKLYPERYDHIWEGDYAKAFEGAYFAKVLALARAQGRIGKVAADPLLPIRASSIWAARAPKPTRCRSGLCSG